MNRQINHKTMRVIVGVIALSLAPVVYFLAGSQQSLTSISISYWTDARDVFVGSLIAVGFFLSAYNGSGGRKDWEYYLSKASCIFAICVALFPTPGFDAHNTPPAWVAQVAGSVGLKTFHIHYGAAMLLFICLIAMMWFFSDRALHKGKVFRAYFYRVVSVLMLGGILVIGVLGYLLSWAYTVLAVEVWGLTFFGIGWLTAGSYKTEPSLNHV